ncbi:MAG TPA: SCO family protein [Gallionella sp.]|nr:SCO family protein [Gallionella sp.]
MFRLKLLIALLLILGLTACGEPKLPSPFHASEVGGKLAQADFRLTDYNGKPRTLADFRGKAVVLFFGYIHCPDVCPTTLADLAQTMRLLGKDAERVQVLFVTVDPERDTPALLAQYVPTFDPAFLALSGDAQATAQAAEAFAVSYRKQTTSSGYSMDHSSSSFIIDPAGRVRLLAPYGQRAEWLADDLRLLLALDRSKR